MNRDTVLRLARAINPPDSRERRFEEWRADAAGCAEIGISSTSIEVGALRLATAARAQLLLSLVAARLRSRAVVVGVFLGAACAVCGIPVLTVVLLAVLLQGSAYCVTRWTPRSRRSQVRRLETGR